jgi:hypothetical protein
MKTIRLWHTYIACAFAPLTVFFLISGGLQSWNLHKGRKDNSYTPPAIVAKLCEIHTDQHWPPADAKAPKPTRWPFRIVSTLLAVGMLNTVALGVVMAFRFTTNRRRISLLLLAGALVPIVVILLQ